MDAPALFLGPYRNYPNPCLVSPQTALFSRIPYWISASNGVIVKYGKSPNYVHGGVLGEVGEIWRSGLFHAIRLPLPRFIPYPPPTSTSYMTNTGLLP